MKKVGIIMGSDSDLPVVRKAVDILREFEVPFEVHVFSAHRTPAEARSFAVGARREGFGAIIAGEVDDIPEAAFYNVGTLDDARAKAKTLGV